MTLNFEQIRKELDRYAYADLAAMPTIEKDHDSNLKLRTETVNVWLDRSSVSDWLDRPGVDAPSRLVVVTSLQGEQIGCYIAAGDDDGYSTDRQQILQLQQLHDR